MSADDLEDVFEAVQAPFRKAIEALWEVVRDVLAPAFRRLVDALSYLHNRPKRKPLIHNGKKPKKMIPENTFQTKILFGLNFLGKHVYGGTVSAATKAKRRAMNKAARKARRTARGG
ncbi:hypothetical protein ACFVGV_06000 [Pseudarthrobacter scleromae]|uniref:hypothetical protein n=1 Tax=Pseudarthrobacter scleromae TaxID=158897 RepID=UPI0036330C89